MSFCPTCDREVTPAQEILPGGVVVTACPKCEYPFDKTEKAKGAQAKPQQRAVRVVSAANDDPIEHVRARLASVEVELERMDQLKRERDTLRRMLRAAERKR